MRVRFIVALFAGVLLMACSEQDRGQTAAPAPGELTRDAIGYYCNMIVADHHGPKGQVHIDGRDEPIWFTSVRDTIVFTLLPEEPRNIVAIYVNDMGRASWDRPGAGSWIDARKAWYVLGSDKVGGMGAPEAVPFAEKIDAESFAGRQGGQVVAFADVPRDYVLSDASQSMHEGMRQQSGHGHGAEGAVK
jgi:copper chaperone NosL